MKSWPVPESYFRSVPLVGQPGGFWEDRADRRHCGVDIYAARGKKVLSVESGIVVDVGLFTSPEIIPYSNRTYYVLVKNSSGFLAKYAELEDLAVLEGDVLGSGDLIGHVGQVLNGRNVVNSSPEYVKMLKDKHPSMLHFELYTEKAILHHDLYASGNWFGDRKPDKLVDPSEYLESNL